LIRSTLDYVQKQRLAGIEYAQSAIKSIAYESAWESYQAHYLACNGQASEVYPGVREGLQALAARGYKMACLTNKPLAFAQPLLKAKGLDGFFSHVFGGDSFERKKPDPLPLLRTCEALGTLPQHTLMIGDSSNDAQAAHAALCPVVLMTYGYNHGNDIRAKLALAHLSSLAELPALLS
jgi:phosphoglycolate phosphatase